MLYHNYYYYAVCAELHVLSSSSPSIVIIRWVRPVALWTLPLLPRPAVLLGYLLSDRCNKNSDNELMIFEFFLKLNFTRARF